MFRRILLSCACMAVMCIAGCASTPQTPLNSLVPQYLTGKLIEQGKTPEERLAKAQRVKAIAEDAKSFFAGEGLTVEELAQAARGRIAELHLETSDLIAANALVNAAVEYLNKQITDGVISPEKRTTVNQLLDWIIQAAELYGA